MNNPVIKLSNITKKYFEGKENELEILHGRRIRGVGSDGISSLQYAGAASRKCGIGFRIDPDDDDV